VIFRKIILLFFLVVFHYFVFAQQITNKHSKLLSVTYDTTRIDTLSIVPGTVIVKNKNGNTLDTSDYKINCVDGLLIVKKKKLDSLQVAYQTFPYLFSSEAKHKSLNNIKTNPVVNNSITSFSPYTYNIGSTDNNIFNMGSGLDKTGSISRGISFGNTQNMIVNSNLNLQLSGHLSNNVDILMSATDNNIPIQADGNSQQLQDFDKVFIQLSKGNTKLIAGDFVLTKPNSYFMNFNEKSQGICFATAQKVNLNGQADAGTFKTTTSMGVARGQWARNTIQGIEGNQGPYRLQGANNEAYIVILSGTEKVYIDGRLLSRGQQNDYIIDYNSATITFTVKQLITLDKRIIVEFQYSSKNYSRSLAFSGNEFETKKYNLHLDVYSEQDNKNQPIQSLSSSQIKTLSKIGDTLSKAVSSSADSVAFSNTEVLYKLMDTTVATITYPIYQYCTDSLKAKYLVTFTNVGQGNGNYIQVMSSANGNVYQWIAPDPETHKMNGTYAPVAQLITPKQKQMVTAGVDYKFSKNTLFSAEGAVTNSNLNTFSSIDQNNDVGYGLKMNMDNKKLLNPIASDDSTTKKLSLITNANYEYVQKNFSPVQLYRSVEFQRDWNLPVINNVNNSYVTADQHIFGVGTQLVKGSTASVGYKINGLLEANTYNGIKQSASMGWNKNGLKINYDGSLLNSQSTAANTRFYRHMSGISQTIKKITFGYKDVFEQNKFSKDSLKKDSLLANSYQYWEWQTYAQNTDTTKTKYGVYYKQRSDYLEKNGELVKSSLGKSYGCFLELLKNRNSQFKINTAYRTLQILDTTISSQKPDNTLISRIEYNLRLWKGAVTSNSFYEVGSGLQVKQQYSYVQVAAGQGVYTWIDFNHDGIAQLNEFQIAAFPSEATYIRVYTPTNSYISVYNNQFSEQLMIKPSVMWAHQKGIKKFISNFADQTAYRVDRKTTDGDYKTVLNPFLKETQKVDSNIVTLNSSFRNTIFFNQLNPVFGFDLSYQSLKTVTLLVSGLENRQNNFNQANVRWNVAHKFNLSFTGINGIKSYQSQYFSTNDYSIIYYEAQPKFSYQPTTSFRLTVSYKLTNKKNNPDLGGQQAILYNYGTELKYNILQKGSLNATFNLIQVSYNGAESTSQAYEMLEGLQSGQNFTWGLTYQRNLSNNMQLSITYTGRKSEGVNVVQTGGAQIRAYF